MKDTRALLAHICQYWDFSTHSFTLKLNYALQWSHLINLDCRVALFSKMRWLYPSYLLPWYLKVKGICSFFSLIFFSLVILCISTYFLGNIAIHCLSVYWKMWRLLGPAKQSTCPPLLMRRKQQLSRAHWVLSVTAQNGKGDLKSRAYEKETHTKLFLCISWKESWNTKSESILKSDFDGK